MNTECLESQFLFKNPLTCTGDFIQKFASELPFSLAIKEKNTKKILSYNKACAKVWGLEKEGMEGLTARDILGRVSEMTPFIEEEVARIETNEQTALDNNSQSSYLQTVLIPNGTILVRRMLATPIFGLQNYPIAIAALNIDLTPHAKLHYLFKVYKQFFTQKSKAVTQFSTYLKLDKFFYENLTCMELNCLITMVSDSRHKQVVIVLSELREKAISLTTVHNYVDSIKNKLKKNIDLNMVLAHLRSRGEWNPELATS